MTLVEDQDLYRIYELDFIKKNHKQVLNDTDTIREIIEDQVKSKDTTWNYNRYNVFSSAAFSFLYWEIYRNLSQILRDFSYDKFNVKKDYPIWCQAWLNYHDTESIVEDKLKLHGHECDFHGYISIDPQDTTTEFVNGLKIKNTIGKLYVGPGLFQYPSESFKHRVVVNSPNNAPRITIGFDANFSRTNRFSEHYWFPIL